MTGIAPNPARNLAADPDPGGCLPSECVKVTQVIGRIGDKWTVLVIILLRERGHRFNEIKRGIDGISQRMLTLTLRNMERDGLVTRTLTPSIPPRVDYELTDIGRSLAEPLKILGEWAFQHLDRINAARTLYDARNAGSA